MIDAFIKLKQVKTIRSKNILEAILFCVVLIFGMGTGLPFQEQENEVYAQGTQDPSTQAPAKFEPEATIYRVTFHSIKINENHDTILGTGEWKLFAAVNHKIRLLETCGFLAASEPDEKVDCNGQMYDVRDGQIVKFQSLYTDVKIGKGGAITVFVEGIDTDGEAWNPPSIPPNLQTYLRIAAATSVYVSGMPINPITAIEFLSEVPQIMKTFASYDKNDKLGTVHEMYRGPNYQKTSVMQTSDKGDYALQYSIKALSPEHASYSHAEDCKPPIAGSYCPRQQP
jgi:hypothetical protein